MPHEHDFDLTAGDIAQFTTADALAAFLARIGYDAGARAVLTPEAIGLSGSAATPIHQIELLSEDSEGFLRVIFVRLKSLTAKSRNDLARVLGRTNVDHLLILASDFEILEFVLLDKRKQESRGAVVAQRLQVVPRTFSVNRRSPGRLELRALRRLTWTGADGRRFFHWEIEFPEVFFGFKDANQRQIEHKDRIAEGAAGFDAVVGNSPYVRQESIKEFKDYLKADYTTFNATNDLYVYFQEREIRNLRVGGRMSMIVANKWMRAGYCQNIRAFLRHVAQPLEVVDFGHSPIFPEADTFPCIVVVGRRNKPLKRDDTMPDGEEMGLASCPENTGMIG